MTFRRWNALFPLVVFRPWRDSGTNSRVFRALVVAAAIVTSAALGTRPALAPGDTNGTPLPPHPMLTDFGLTREQVPERVYLVRTRAALREDVGVIVHAQRGRFALVSGPPAAIARLRAIPAEVMTVDLSTYAPPAPSRVWRPVTEANPTVQREVDNVTWTGVLSKIQMLVDFGPRRDCDPCILTGAVPDTLEAFFRGLGLDVVQQEYRLYHLVYCDPRPTGRNVIATQRGVDYPDSIIVISAHYDSYRGPGADDNASGVAAVMTAAELLSRHRFAYTIQYICFGNEEYCGCGSRYYVDQLYRDHVNLIGALNFDMIGFWKQGVVFDLEVEASATSAWLAAAFVNAAELYTDTPCDTHITNIGMSDNYQFWMRGYSALNLEEAWIGPDGDLNPHWHQKDDVIRYLHPGITVANTRAAVAGLATLARLLNVRAVVDIDPKSLNPRSQGRWITARIELPAEHDLREVDMSSIRLNKAVAAEIHPPAIGDADEDGVPDLMVKFSRGEVVGVLGEGELGEGENALLTVSGSVGGECFEGCDTIRVLWSVGREEAAAMDREPSNQIELVQNFPNPFNPTTTMSFFLPEKTRAVLSIYDVEGRLVITLVDDTSDEGLREVVWDGKDANGSQVGSGVYFYRLKAGSQTLTKTMVLLK